MAGDGQGKARAIGAPRATVDKTQNCVCDYAGAAPCLRYKAAAVRKPE